MARGLVGATVAWSVIATQLSALGYDNAIATNTNDGAHPGSSSILRGVIVASFGRRIALAGMLTALACAVLWPEQRLLLSIVWFGAVMCASSGLIVLGELQRTLNDTARLIGQGSQPVVGIALILVLAAAARLSETWVLVSLGIAAIVSLPIRFVIWRFARAGTNSPVDADFGDRANRYLKLQVPLIALQRMDIVVLSLVIPLHELGLYAFAYALGYGQTAILEQLVKREMAVKQYDHPRVEASQLGPLFRRYAIVSGAATLALGLGLAFFVVPSYRAAGPILVVLIPSWLIHYSNYREEMLRRTSATGTSSAIYGVGLLLMASLAVGGTIGGAVGGALGFLVTNIVWHLLLRYSARGRRRAQPRGRFDDTSAEGSVDEKTFKAVRWKVQRRQRHSHH